MGVSQDSLGTSEAAMQSSMAPCVLRQWNSVQLALEVDLMVRTKKEGHGAMGGYTASSAGWGGGRGLSGEAVEGLGEPGCLGELWSYRWNRPDSEEPLGKERIEATSWHCDSLKYSIYTGFHGNFDLLIVFVVASAITEDDWVSHLDIGELGLIF